MLCYVIRHDRARAVYPGYGATGRSVQLYGAAPGRRIEKELVNGVTDVVSEKKGNTLYPVSEKNVAVKRLVAC